MSTSLSKCAFFVYILQSKLLESEQEKDETIAAYQAVQKAQEEMADKLEKMEGELENANQTNKVLSLFHWKTCRTRYPSVR